MIALPPGACVVDPRLRGRPGSALAPPLAAAFPSAPGRACDFPVRQPRAARRRAAPEDPGRPRKPRLLRAGVCSLCGRRGKRGCPGVPCPARAGRRSLAEGAAAGSGLGGSRFPGMRRSLPVGAAGPTGTSVPGKAKSLADAK